MTYRRGSYRKYLARYSNVAVLHHRVEHPEQIQIDHANLDKLPLDIVPTVLDFAFPKSFHVSPGTKARELWRNYTNIGQNWTDIGHRGAAPNARCSCEDRLVVTLRIIWSKAVEDSL